MKTKLSVMFALLLPLAQPGVAAEPLSEALQKGLFEEEANHNLDGAIKAYQSVVTQVDEQRKLAATAVFRLGECYRKLGQTNDAVIQYQRLLRDYSEQSTLANLSRQNLIGLGTAAPGTAGSGLSKAARAEQKRLLEEEIRLVESDLEAQKKQVANGTRSTGELIPTQRQLLGLRRQSAALDSGPDDFDATQTAAAGATDEEDKEVRRITALIKDSPDLINARDKDGTTPLQLAARRGQIAVARFLLANGADINLQGGGGTMPLYDAAANGHRSMTELLIAKGANVMALTAISRGGGQGDKYRRSALHVAAGNGYKSVVEVLLAAKADLNARDDTGSTALLWAVQKPARPIVELLLARGADVNAKDFQEETALHLAAASGQMEIVSLLLSNKADINLRNKEQRTPLHRAAAGGYTEVAALLIANKAPLEMKDRAGNTPLALAVQQNHIFVAQALLDAGADANKASDSAASLLSLAINKGSLEMAAALLEHNADPNFVGRDYEDKEWTALHSAVGSKNAAMVALLLRHHPKLDVRTRIGMQNNSEYGCTPLMMAAMDKQPEILALLVEAKANPNLAADSGNAPLHRAILHASKALVEPLLQHGASLEARSAGGETPLALAVRYAEKDVVALLLEYKADPSARSGDGLTPLHKAVSYDRRAAFDLLIAAKADVNAGDAKGRTPLDYVRDDVRSDRGGIPGPHIMPQPLFGLSPPQANTKPQLNQRQVELSEALRKSGAAEWAPRLDYITLTRRSNGASDAKFQRQGTNDLNRYTLFEAIAAHDWAAQPDRPTTWHYPDFSKVTLTRRDAQSGKIITLPVDVAAKVASGDCTQDMELEWGDLVDLPESEHPLYASWSGLTNEFVASLQKCLERKVTLTIKGQTKTLTLKAETEKTGPVLDGRYDHARFSKLPFRLRETVLSSGLVLTTSDLSRVKVQRLDSATKQPLARTFNLNQGGNEMDLWLHDGDVIEVPEKDPNEISNATPVRSFPATTPLPGIPGRPPRQPVPGQP